MAGTERLWQSAILQGHALKSLAMPHIFAGPNSATIAVGVQAEFCQLKNSKHDAVQ